MAMLKIEYLNPLKLEAYGANARMHSPQQIDQIVNSIREFGFTNPVLIDEDNILIAGHGRTAAAIKMELDAIPAVRLRGLTDSQKKALRIADNQLALNATWDLDLLAAELTELDDVDFDLELIGFDEKFLSGLLGGPDLDIDDEDDQEQPEPSKKIEIILGPYKFKVSAADFSRWETAVRANVGFDVADIEAEIKKRLGI